MTRRQPLDLSKLPPIPDHLKDPTPTLDFDESPASGCECGEAYSNRPEGVPRCAYCVDGVSALESGPLKDAASGPPSQDDRMRERAREQYGEPGSVEIDSGAPVISCGDGSAWVAAWVLVEPGE